MNKYVEKIRFLEQKLRQTNKSLSWWEDMLLSGNILFTGEIKEV